MGQWDPVIIMRNHLRRRALADGDIVWRWNDGRVVSRTSIIAAYQGHQYQRGLSWELKTNSRYRRKVRMRVFLFPTSVQIGEAEPWRTTGHSCRKGLVAAAERLGFPPRVIKMLGRWSSTAWKLYTGKEEKELAMWTRKLACGVLNLRVASQRHSINVFFFGSGDYVGRTVSGETLEISALPLFHIKRRG